MLRFTLAHEDPEEEVFWQKVTKTNTCWLWNGSINNRGYGATSWLGRFTLAHRLSLILNNKLLRRGQIVHHKCEIPRCVRPEHLEIFDDAGSHFLEHAKYLDLIE